ncbi:MAG: hypothetical protein CMN56_05400 [Sneathiella sp.]|nr:hypothetical protein [Sneathiella sp.]
MDGRKCYIITATLWRAFFSSAPEICTAFAGGAIKWLHIRVKRGCFGLFLPLNTPLCYQFFKGQGKVSMRPKTVTGMGQDDER